MMAEATRAREEEIDMSTSQVDVETGAPAAPIPTFDSLNPGTGEVYGTYPVDDEASVAAAVERARDAAAWWAGLGFAGRAARMRAWAGVITRRMAQLAETVHAETGKPHSDAQLELVLAIEHIAWAGKHAAKVLGPQRRSPGLLMANYSATVRYEPLGVVGVIGPWNYPVFTPMGSIAYALAAGNAVVFKPSEFAPGVGDWLVRSFADVVPERPVFQLVTGFGPTGAALCRAGVDKIAFTGSAATGRRVMAACAETLTPVIIEGGGKDALLVDADANLDEAADAAVWGGMFNAGQTCVGVERVYVHEKVHDEFVAKVVAKAGDLRAGADPAAKLGPITMPAPLAVIREHIRDALARGGRALVGGVDSVGDRFVQPTVLVDVPEDAKAVQDETFGPTVTIAKVANMDDAVDKANASRYGLGNAVFSKARGMELANRLRSGMVSVNSVISFAGIPSLPFGGVGDSGFGRIHGADGLREFARAKAIARPRFRAPVKLTTFTRTAKADKLVTTLMTLLHGKR
jgi:acyl-CoA reductase-like NAD-dependent aldehyde dehydrogenase